MHARRALYAVLLLAACHAPAPTEPSAPDLAAAPEAASPAPSADPNAWVGVEMRGARYERATTANLAVLAPREATGAEADGRPRRAFLALSTAEQRDFLEWFTVECEKLGTFQGTLIRYVLDQ